MRILLAGVVFACTACVDGCLPNFGSCDPEYGNEVIPTGLEVTSEGRYVFVAATWFRRVDSCGPGRIGGAIHVVDLSQPDGAPITFDGLPATTGLSAITDDAFITLRGSSWVPPLDAERDYFAVPTSPPFAVRRVAVPEYPIAVGSTGANAAFLLVTDQVLIRRGDSDDVIIAAPSLLRRLTHGRGRIYVSSASGEISEIDPQARVEVRRLASCNSYGPIAVVGTSLVLSSCESGGIALVDTVLNSYAVAVTNNYFSAITGSLNTPRAIVSLPDPQGTGDSLVFDPVVGFVGEPFFGELDDAAVFFSDRAFAVTANAPVMIDLESGESSRIPGILFHSAFSQIALLPPSDVVVVRNRGGFDLELHIIDGATGAALRDPITLPPPAEMPLR